MECPESLHISCLRDMHTMLNAQKEFHVDSPIFAILGIEDPWTVMQSLKISFRVHWSHQLTKHRDEQHMSMCAILTGSEFRKLLLANPTEHGQLLLKVLANEVDVWNQCTVSIAKLERAIGARRRVGCLFALKEEGSYYMYFGYTFNLKKTLAFLQRGNMRPLIVDRTYLCMYPEEPYKLIKKHMAFLHIRDDWYFIPPKTTYDVYPFKGLVDQATVDPPYLEFFTGYLMREEQLFLLFQTGCDTWQFLLIFLEPKQSKFETIRHLRRGFPGLSLEMEVVVYKKQPASEGYISLIDKLANLTKRCAKYETFQEGAYAVHVSIHPQQYIACVKEIIE
jgi:hypothetical protein